MNSSRMISGKNKNIRHSLYLLLLFILSFLYFLIFGNHIFFYQEQQTLFIWTADYLGRFTTRPGGILQYAGNFLSQFYYNPVIGSLIISLLLVMMAWIFLKISKKLYGDEMLLDIFMVIPSCILMLFCSNYNFLPGYILGFLIVAALFLVIINNERKSAYYSAVALFPLVYYLIGGYAWLLAGMYIMYQLTRKQFIIPAFMLIVAFLTLIIFRKFVFYQPLDALLNNPLPPGTIFSHPVYLYFFYGLIILFPLILKLFSVVKVSQALKPFFTVYAVVLIFILTIFIQSRLYNPEVNAVFRIEKLFCDQEWDKVIKLQQKLQLKNNIAQYYYNTALSEKGLLCERLFFGRQDFGTNALMVQWSSKTNINQIFRGAYFFYTLGLINEAHRWAFESMVIQGYRPENLKMLIRTELINGHYTIAGRYIGVLRNTLHYRKLADRYTKMLGNPDLVNADAELGAKIKLLPQKDFYIRLTDQQDNVLLMLEANSGNRKAFEYMLAWFLLERNVKNACDNIPKMKGMGYSRLPRYIEEAVVYLGTMMGDSPDLNGFSISAETTRRFQEFGSAVSVLTPDRERIRGRFGNTLWYYLEFR